MSDDYQSVSVADARAAVQASGELEGIEGPLFLADGENPEWEPWFLKRLGEEDSHPDFAQVIITRKGQAPRRVVIAWDEYAEQMDADPAWDAIRASKPMTIFGSEVERHAYRVVFADVLAPLLAPKLSANTPPSERATGDPVTTDGPSAWLVDVKRANAARLNELYDDARAVGALVKIAGLQQAFTERMLELSAEAVTAQTVTPAQVAQTAKVGQGQRPPRNRGRGKR